MTTPDVRCTCTGTCHPEHHRIYVCARCAHTFTRSEWPNRCEACGDGASASIRVFDGFDVAERFSQSILDARGARGARVLAATDHIGRGTRNV